MESPAPVFVIFIIIAVVGLMVSRVMDTGRVERYVEERGGRLLEKTTLSLRWSS